MPNVHDLGCSTDAHTARSNLVRQGLQTVTLISYLPLKSTLTLTLPLPLTLNLNLDDPYPGPNPFPT